MATTGRLKPVLRMTRSLQHRTHCMLQSGFAHTLPVSFMLPELYNNAEIIVLGTMPYTTSRERGEAETTLHGDDQLQAKQQAVQVTACCSLQARCLQGASFWRNPGLAVLGDATPATCEQPH